MNKLMKIFKSEIMFCGRDILFFYQHFNLNHFPEGILAYIKIKHHWLGRKIHAILRHRQILSLFRNVENFERKPFQVL